MPRGQKSLQTVAEMATRTVRPVHTHYFEWVFFRLLAITPAELTLLSGRYSQTRIMYMFRTGKLSGPAYSNFLDVILTYIKALKQLDLTNRHDQRLRTELVRQLERYAAKAEEDLDSYDVYVPLIEKAARVLRAEFRLHNPFTLADLAKLSRETGITRSTFYAAARRIGVVMRQKGYGKKKTSTWALPEDKQR